MRVIRDGIRERTLGTTSIYWNKKNFDSYINDLLDRANIYRDNPKEYTGTELGRIYQIQLVNNRSGIKKVYYEFEFELLWHDNPRLIRYRTDETLINDKFNYPKKIKCTLFTSSKGY